MKLSMNTIMPNNAASPLRMFGTQTDTMDGKKADEALQKSEERFRLAMEACDIGLWELDMTTYEEYLSPCFFRILGYEPEEIHVTSQTWKEFIHPEDLQRFSSVFLDCLDNRSQRFAVEFRMKSKNGTWKWFLSRGRTFGRDRQGHALHMVGTHMDITERKHAEMEKEKLYSRFLQAQKMESLGRLASGVAHDFNNMLQIILGYSDLLLDDQVPQSPAHKKISEIRKAAASSASQIRQLLAYARKQPVSPIVIDFNETVSDILKMLQRAIGAAVDLVWMPCQGLWNVRIDPSQVDQLLVNLVINARDAISGPGNIVITTENTTLAETHNRGSFNIPPGKYVLLAVSDTGCGMDKETMLHLFETFFTTKEPGKGTGLGLATVYGIVTQNEGYIDVYSEPGQGSVFKVYLPATEDPTAQSTLAKKEPPGGTETILLVEDAGALLNLCNGILTQLGYKVLAAGAPAEALRLAESQEGEIDLLLTDVVMPEMNGPVLAKQLVAMRPGLKCLYMSGYNANCDGHDEARHLVADFIQKPFSVNDLACKIRECLDRPGKGGMR